MAGAIQLRFKPLSLLQNIRIFRGGGRSPSRDLCAAQGGASQPAGQRAAVLLSLYLASSSVGTEA